jgi:nucleoside-diphosphate-sugar epimerase
MSRTALITGVTGYIGGKLAERLVADGWTVHALVRGGSERPATAQIRFHVHDGSAAGLTAVVREAAPDIVFHLASLYLAEHRPEEVDQLIASNVLLPAQLAEAMTAAGAARLVNTGTAWQHFNTPGYNPVNLYAATKQAAVDILRYFHDARGLSVVTLKLFDTFGPGDKRRKLIQVLVDAALSGERLEMSPGEQLIDLTHIDDVIDAFLVAADRLLASVAPLNEEFLISGTRRKLRELVEITGEALGRDVHVTLGARPYRAREVMVPAEAPAERQLPGWKPSRELTEAIRDLAGTKR